MRRTLTVALAGSLLLVLCGLAVVGLRVQQVHLAYRLDALRAERTRLEGLIRQLEVEVATLRSPGRIEGRARQLGLITPRPQQVRLAREFVPGTTGLAAELNRVAASGAPLRSEAGARRTLEP